MVPHGARELTIAANLTLDHASPRAHHRHCKRGQMSVDRDLLRWNGWGRSAESMELSEGRRAAVLAALSQRFGRPLLAGPTAAPITAVSLPASRLTAEARAALTSALGATCVRLDDKTRAQHAAGKSFPDLLRIRAGKLERAPDAVLYPSNVEAVAATLRIAHEHGLAIIPFGGGTSVVGGVEPLLPEGKHAVLALDTTDLNKLISLDEISRTATFQAGIDGPALEACLSERGYTLGHFPQSFEHSTLGGWIAARSSGQQSDGYGGIETMLVSARMLTPQGELKTLGVPRNAAGPDLKEAILGSEGTLGVIVEATVRIRAKPQVQDIRGMMFRDFSAGVTAIRALMDAGLPMTMMRLSDAQETDLSLLLKRDPARKLDASATFLNAARALGYADRRSVMLYGIEGDDRSDVSAQMVMARKIGVKHGGLPLGKGPGNSWKKERFKTPYLRDFLLDEGVAIDTMETAFSWRDLARGHERVVEALRTATVSHAGAGLSMGHVSHSYPDGACVYFIVLYPLAQSERLAQWQAIKRAATDAIVAAGGTVSHHHGVGTDHAPWLAAEKGELGMVSIRALKAALDPAGIMNPGKLV